MSKEIIIAIAELLRILFSANPLVLTLVLIAVIAITGMYFIYAAGRR